MGRAQAHKLVLIMLPRKTSKRAHQVTVPETDTGRLPENGKALERNLAKELGNIAP